MLADLAPGEAFADAPVRGVDTLADACLLDSARFSPAPWLEQPLHVQETC
jgi:hypothetical protein